VRRVHGRRNITSSDRTKRANQGVEVWRTVRRLGTVPLGDSGCLLPSNVVSEEGSQWLATAMGMQLTEGPYHSVA
jgi:hypothetical protein